MLNPYAKESKFFAQRRKAAESKSSIARGTGLDDLEREGGL